MDLAPHSEHPDLELLEEVIPPRSGYCRRCGARVTDTDPVPFPPTEVRGDGMVAGLACPHGGGAPLRGVLPAWSKKKWSRDENIQ